MAKKIVFDFNNRKKAKKNLKKGLAVGAAVGTAVGAVSGILLAPKSGKDTREKIKKDVVCTAKKASEAAKDMKETANKAGEVVREKLNEIKAGKLLVKKTDVKESDGEAAVTCEASKNNENNEPEVK